MEPIEPACCVRQWQGRSTEEESCWGIFDGRVLEDYRLRNLTIKHCLDLISDSAMHLTGLCLPFST